jgi:hypothetical protein
MSADDLRKLLNAVPFRPFTVYLPSENAFIVPHPDFALLTPNGRTMVVAQEQTSAVDLLDVPFITRIEVAPEHAAES